MNRQTKTKEAILESALYLFHLKGYHATSIRDIAHKAKVNSANIAYYFKNKQGLLEYCFTAYLEAYIQLLEKNLVQLDRVGIQNGLLAILTDAFEFQRKNFLAASFIYGESALDSNLNREVLSTYYMKENSYFQYVLEKGIKEGLFRKIPPAIFTLQIKGLLSAPIIHAHYAREVLHVYTQEKYYTDKYCDEVRLYLEQSLFVKHDRQEELLYNVSI